MKTYLTKNTDFLNITTTWQRKLNGLSWLRPSLGEFISSQLKKILNVLADQGRVVGLHALVSSARVNARIFMGLVLVGVLAPLAGCSYLLFDKKEIVEGWYYVNYFYLFLVLAPSLKEIIVFIGVYHLFPKNSRRAYLLAIPMGFSVGKLLWLVTISTNEQFHSVMPNHVVFTGILLSLVTFLSIDFFAWRKFHGADSYDARLDGLHNVSGDESIPDDKFRVMFRTTYKARKDFQKQY